MKPSAFKLFPVIFILTFSARLSAQSATTKCNCKISPYRPDPPCYDYCMKQLIHGAKSSELVMILGLSDTLAGKIVRINSTVPINSMQDYYSRLSPPDGEKLRIAVDKANKWQLYYFSRPLEDRNKMTLDLDQFLKQKQEFDKTHG